MPTHDPTEHEDEREERMREFRSGQPAGATDLTLTNFAKKSIKYTREPWPMEDHECGYDEARTRHFYTLVLRGGIRMPNCTHSRRGVMTVEEGREALLEHYRKAHRDAPRELQAVDAVYQERPIVDVDYKSIRDAYDAVLEEHRVRRDFSGDPEC